MMRVKRIFAAIGSYLKSHGRDLALDIIGLLGLSMLAYGLFQVSPVIMFIIIGIIFLYAAIYPYSSRTPKG